jgi:phenylacetate-coenzyme A ligase PaaK-like adenylate-forming protein
MMTAFEHLLSLEPFSLPQKEKDTLYETLLSNITLSHFEKCAEYQSIIQGLGHDPTSRCASEQQPFLPVRLFKDHELKSVAQADVHKVMTSSGTSGQQVSKIYLDKTTAGRQTKVLAKLVTDLLGPKRLPMLVIDAKETVKNRQSFSARGAGILGFSLFGRDVTFALDANMQLNISAVQEFCAKHAGSDIFIFGFTSIIYQHFIQAAQTHGVTFPLEKATLLHGGGWKKLENISVDNQAFKNMLNNVAGIQKVYNYYGMVEQTGSIFTECKNGHLHCSLFSDIIIRDTNLGVASNGQRGLVQLVSLLPESYPGHSILTEDIGEILGQDNCGCGRLGKYFRIYGRAHRAEVRGCSDTYAA